MYNVNIGRGVGTGIECVRAKLSRVFYRYLYHLIYLLYARKKNQMKGCRRGVDDRSEIRKTIVCFTSKTRLSLSLLKEDQELQRRGVGV